MPHTPGQFVWHELMTTDPPGARAFYSSVVGWTPVDGNMPGHDYWLMKLGDRPVVGVMELPAESRSMGAPPSWIGYVAVADVDATAAQVTARGGKVYVPATDIPDVGRFAIVADPHGAVVGLLKSAHPDQDWLPEQQAQGHVGWNELYAGDLAADFPFYASLFGWEKKDAMDMGPMGVYQIFGTADATLGGMMTKMPEMPVAAWSYYFNVGNIDEAAARVTTAGGQVIMGPQQVPGGQYVLQGVDPQGAHFALLSSR